MLRSSSTSGAGRSTASTSPSHHGVFHVFQSNAFLARPVAFFLATPAAFLRIPRLTAFLMESTRSRGVSRGSVPASSEKGNSCANSALLGWGVNLSFFLALGVMFGLGGTGGFLGPTGVDPCFIPWVALTKCVNHAYIGPASKSSSPGVVAPVALTPPVGAPNGWRPFLVQWRN